MIIERFMYNRTIYILLVMFCVLSGRNASSAVHSENIAIELSLSNPLPTIGDSLTIYCTVLVPEGIQAGDPLPTKKSPLVDIEHQWKHVEESGNGITRETHGFLVYIFTPDTLTIGPFTVNYLSDDGEDGSISSAVLTVPVKSILENSESPLLPNRVPVGIPSTNILFWLIPLLVMCVLIIIALIYMIRKKKTKGIPLLPVPIDEIGEFERIRKQKLHEKGQIKELYILVSNAMRGFIHRNMNYEALYKTSEEIFAELFPDLSDITVSNDIKNVFDESDMVKFAKFHPPDELTSTIIDRAERPVKTVLEKIKLEKFLEAEKENLNNLKKESQKAGEKKAVSNSGGER